jgi:hypothetical protein
MHASLSSFMEIDSPKGRGIKMCECCLMIVGGIAALHAIIAGMRRMPNSDPFYV